MDSQQTAETIEITSRVTGSFIGPVERPLLESLARALPRRIIPDHLTLLGLAGAAITACGYVLSSWHPGFLWLASFGLAVNWFGDSLDGTLARIRRCERPRYGFFIDHGTDILSQLMVGLGLGLSPFVRFDVACLALLVFLAFVALSMMKAVVSGHLQISYGGIGPTEIRCALIAINALLYWYRPTPVFNLWEPLTVIDLAVLAAACAGAALLFFSGITALRQIAKEEG